ncbi:MAG: hypothetical protein OJF47_003466 [Nitrospira sp.]|nr:MAG: hypothetical protein OJF47_003466 [Nitrospira sp.]
MSGGHEAFLSDGRKIGERLRGVRGCVNGEPCSSPLNRIFFCGRFPRHLHLGLVQMSTATGCRTANKMLAPSTGFSGDSGAFPSRPPFFPAFPSRSRLRSSTVSPPTRPAGGERALAPGLLLF